MKNIDVKNLSGAPVPLDHSFEPRLRSLTPEKMDYFRMLVNTRSFEKDDYVTKDYVAKMLLDSLYLAENTPIDQINNDKQYFVCPDRESISLSQTRQSYKRAVADHDLYN